MSDQKLPNAAPGHPQPPGYGPPRPPAVRPAPAVPLVPPTAPGSAVHNPRTPVHDTTSMELIAESETRVGTKIRAYGVAEAIQRQTQFKRPTTLSHHGTGACRIRTFHGRLSDEGLAFMDEKINQWLDEHPDIEVKFVSTSVGLYEGKIKEPCLIMTVWY